MFNNKHTRLHIHQETVPQIQQKAIRSDHIKGHGMEGMRINEGAEWGPVY